MDDLIILEDALPDISRFTHREMQVLQQLSKGKSNEAIVRNLGISRAYANSLIAIVKTQLDLCYASHAELADVARRIVQHNENPVLSRAKIQRILQEEYCNNPDEFVRDAIVVIADRLNIQIEEM